MGVKGVRKLLCMLVVLAFAAESCAGGSSGASSSALASETDTQMEETLPESQEKETQSKGLLPGIFSPDGRTSAESETATDGRTKAESETSSEERTSAESSGEGTAAEEQGGSTKSEETDPGEPGKKGFSPLWLIGIAAAAAVAAMVWFGIRAKGRPRNEDEPIRQPETLSRTGEPVVPAAAPQAPPPVKEAGGMWIGNAHHIGARQNQQDSFAISDVTNQQLCRAKGMFAVVADGMGGLSNGAQISAMVTSSMMRRFENDPMVPEIPAELLQMVHQASEEVNGYLGEAVGQSGSTVVAVWVSGMRLHFISVGDSRIYLVRGGTLTQLNREHTYASELDEQAARGKISWEEARSDPQRHALTSYIGMGELEQIDRSLHPLPLIAGDRVLLMTDGVFGTLSEQEILEAVSGNAMEAARRIEEKVLEKRKPTQDNFTAVILQWN